MTGIGHNGGPTMEPGRAWRRFAWTKARADLLPNLPIEVVRRRVKRARALGIDYKSYASLRAASGHDVVALLFSSNALRLLRQDQALPADRAAKLANVTAAGRLTLVHAPLDPARVIAANSVIDRAGLAPGLFKSWSEIGVAVKGFLVDGRLTPDRVVLICDTGLEREWLSAGNLMGYVPAERYFGGVEAGTGTG